jgi:hypothetical protein
MGLNDYSLLINNKITQSKQDFDNLFNYSMGSPTMYLDALSHLVYVYISRLFV